MCKHIWHYVWKFSFSAFNCNLVQLVKHWGVERQALPYSVHPSKDCSYDSIPPIGYGVIGY